MTNDEVIEVNFMGILAEMSVMYFDHMKRSKKNMELTQRSFEVFCERIRIYLFNPPLPKKNASMPSEEVFISWLLMELDNEFGLGGDVGEKMGANLVLTFFTERYWADIYTIQREANNYLFPKGYYNKLKSNL